VTKETESLIKRLKAADFKIISVNDGDEEDIVPKSEQEAVEILTSVDKSWLTVKRGEYSFTLLLVYGNSPGELVCDYSWSKTADGSSELALLDKLTEEHSNEWETP